MANRTEHEMIFQLGAKLGSNFNSTFSGASQTILKMQQEIQTLNRTQSDISAYQKQQSAIETTKSKLEMLQKQYDNIQQEMKETGNDSADMKNKLLAKQQQIDKTSASLENQTSKLDRMGTALKEAGVNTDDLTGESARLEAEMGELKTAQEEAAESAEQYQQSGAQAFETVSSALAAAGIAKGLKEIYEAYKECVGIAADFEETMSTVEALSGASDDEMSQLNDMAKELGATTKFTAIESGEAMTYMAMAGWDANEMLSGMDGVLQLAAASGEDLAMVSDIVTDNLTAFGLSASDTAHFSDILAAAATNSNTSVSIMGETFKNSASIAGALGYSVEDVAVAVGLMANAGVKGSMAGTALKNTFNGLLEGATLTSDAFGEVEFSALNTDGTMKSFSQTVDELRGYFDQMTEAERVNNAMAIAGSRSYNGLLAIVNATDEDFNSLTASINDCSGAAQEMAQIKLDNLNGDITLMNSAMDALKTTLGESYRSELRALTSLFTELINVINTFAQEHPALTKAIIAFIAVLGLVTAGLTAYVAITKIAAVVTPLFTAAIPGVNIIMAVSVAVAALTAGITALVTAVKNNESEYDTWTASTKNQYDAIQELQEEYEKACETYGETSDEARALAGEIDAATQAFEESKETVAEYEAELENLNESIATTSSEFHEQMDTIDIENERVLSLATRLEQLATESGNTASAQEEMSLIISSLNELLPDLDLKLEDVTSGTTDFMAAIESMAAEDYNTKKAEAALESYLTLYSDLMTATDDYQKAKENEAAALGRYTKALKEYQDYYKNGGSNYNEGHALYLDMGRAKDAYHEASEQTAAFADAQTAAQEAADEAGEAYADAAGIAVESYQEMLENAESAADVSEAVETALLELAETYKTVYEAAYESFTEQFGLFDEAKADSEATVQAAQEAMNSQLQFWQNYSSNISTLRGVSYEDLGITQENWEAMISYAQSGTEEAAGFAASLAEAVNSGNTDAIVTLANTIGAVQTARETAAGEVAAWQTDFDSKMQEIVDTMGNTIDDLDMSTEATESAKNTMLSYASSISSNGATAVANAQSIAAQVKAALEGASATVSVGVSSSGSTGTGYATGTENATVGWHLVGEKGPEIVYFGGGETVYNADETKKLLNGAHAESQMTIVSMLPLMADYFEAVRDYSTPQSASPVEAISYNSGQHSYTIAPQFNITCNGTEDLEDKLRDYANVITEQVLDTLEEAETDVKRGAYV